MQVYLLIILPHILLNIIMWKIVPNENDSI